jgi:hypothetical protein
MKIVCMLLLMAGSLSGQTPPTSSAPMVSSTLQRIEQTAQAANLDLARLRIDKWKTEGSIKDQSQANADSLSRNMSAALPTLIAGVRAAPQNLAANFKLYRNLNALYDVFEGLAESAGAFGSKQEFEALSRHVQDLDTLRRAFGDYVESLAAAKDVELARAKAPAPAPQAARPKKIIVDNEVAPKPSKKKK